MYKSRLQYFIYEIDPEMRFLSYQTDTPDHERQLTADRDFPLHWLAHKKFYSLV